MRGCWLSQAECCRLLDVTQTKFDRTLAPHLKWKFKGARKLYFLTEDKMTDEVIKLYDDQMKELDDEAQQVEDVLGDLTDASGVVTDELTAARLDNLKARTRLIEEKLEARKSELWSEWNSVFFEAFTEAFAKFKNEIISLHLNEEQLTVFQEKLETALTLMKTRLDGMWNRFKEEEDEEQDK